MTARNPFALFSAMLFIFAACGDTIDPGNTSRPSKIVRTATSIAEFSELSLAYDAVGTVQAEISSMISSKITGTVRAVHVGEGDRVQRGQILVEIDPREVSARFGQAQAGLEESRKAEDSAFSAMMAARAGADLAKATYDRYIRLMADESASRQEFDEVQAEFQRAKAFLDQTAATLEAARHRVKQAEAAVDAAAVVKEDASVAAPYDGVVTSKHVEIGDLVSQGVPLIALETLGRFRVDLVVPENQVHAIRTDQPIFVLVPSVAQTRYQGSVQTIVPTADPKSRTFLVKVSLPDPPAIRSGMFARGLISLGRENKLLVAGRSIVHRGQLTGVYAVDDKGVAQFRLLRLGNAHGEMVEVLSGLKAGTRYIVEPGPDVFHGVRVEEPS